MNRRSTKRAGSVRSVLVLGGASDIGQATARRLVRDGARVVTLAARFPQRLEGVAAELRDLGALSVDLLEFDADDLPSHGAFVERVFGGGEAIDLVLMAFGVYGDQLVAGRDAATAVALVHTNFLGAVSILIPVAERMRRQGHGRIVILSSIAGEHPRKRNFVYAASKAGLDAFGRGLGSRLAGTGVDVMVVRPGFVRGKMTAGRTRVSFATTPDDVAAAIASGMARRADIVWIPPSLRWVMRGIRHLPRRWARHL